MGRIGFSPFDVLGQPRVHDPLERLLAGTPYASVLKPPAEPSVKDLLPSVDAAREQSVLGGLTENSLGGLAYLGKVADKTFGGRAVRGALGGNANELLSVLPFSDTLGLTNESDAVSGRQLLQNLGVVGKGDPNSFDTGDALGFAAELALDPSTYLGFGPLTKAGVLAKKAAGLPRGFADRAAGFAARETDLAPVASAAGREVSDVLRDFGLAGRPVLSREAEQLARTAGEPILTSHVWDPLAGTLIRNPEGPATPLAGLLGVGLPFRAPSLVLGAGRTLSDLPGVARAGAALSAADRGVQAVTGYSPAATAQAVADPIARTLRGLFGHEYKGTYDPRAQELARDVISPLERERSVATRGTWFDTLKSLEPFTEKGPDEARAALNLYRSAAEGVGDIPLQLQLPGVTRPDLFFKGTQAAGQRAKAEAEAAKYFTPAEAGEIRKLGDAGRDLLASVRQEAKAKGVNEPELLDNLIQYFTRSKADLPKQPGESVFSYRNRLAATYAAEHASQLKRDKLFRDIPGGTTQINDLAKDPRLSGPARNIGGTPTTDAQAVQILLQELTGIADPKLADRRVMGQARRLNDWLKGLPEAHVKDKADFFSIDAPFDVATRLNRAYRAMTAADAVTEGAVRFANSKAAIEAAGDEAVPLAEVLKQFKLTGKADGSKVPVALDAILKRLAQSPGQTQQLFLPAGMVNDLLRVNEAVVNPRSLSPVIQAWDWATNLFKNSVTAPFVSFHTRNLASGLFNMWRGGVYGSPAELQRVGSEAMQVLRGRDLAGPLPGMSPTLNASQATDAFLKEVVAHNVAFGRRAGQASDDLIGQAGEALLRKPRLPEDTGKTAAAEVGDFLKGFVPEKGKLKEQLNPLNQAGVNRDEDTFVVLKQARAAGQTIEDWLRTTHYLGLRRQGFSPAAAAQEVRKYQIDYSQLAPFERDVAKRVFPWYAFSRRNLPPLLEDLAEQPAKITAALRATTGLREKGQFIPGYVAEGASLPIGGAPDGQQRYVTGFGLPFEDEAVKTLGSLAQGDLSRAAQQFLGQAQPGIKAPLEFTFDKQLYSGRPLEDLKPYEFATLGGLLGDKTGRIATQVGANTPASRLLSTGNRLLDERKDLPTQLVNLLTGVRISDVDVEKARDAAAKDLLAKLLLGQPGVKSTSDIYVTREGLPQVPEEEKLLYRLYLNADQRLREKAKERRAGATAPR